MIDNNTQQISAKILLQAVGKHQLQVATVQPFQVFDLKQLKPRFKTTYQPKIDQYFILFFPLFSSQLLHLFNQLKQEILQSHIMEKSFVLIQELLTAAEKSFNLKKYFWKVKKKSMMQMLHCGGFLLERKKVCSFLKPVRQKYSHFGKFSNLSLQMSK